MIVKSPSKALVWLRASAAQEAEELRRLASRYVTDPATQEDAVQQALANAWAFLVQGGAVRNGKAWLRTLLFNEIRRCWRQRRRWLPLPTECADLLPSQEHTSADSDEAAELCRRIGRLRSAFDQHPNDLGFLVLQMRLGDLPYDRIGQIVGRSPTACRVTASRARTRLKEMLCTAEMADAASGRSS